MTAALSFLVIDVIGTNAPLASKFESLGMESEEVEALVQCLKRESRVPAGADIVYADQSVGYSTLLLTGIACSYKRSKSGTRHIYAFLYPGEFCDLSRYLLPEWDETLTVQALSQCSIATILYSEIRQLLVERPRLRLALWRATMLEASILRQWLSNARQGSAVGRVANLLSEQLVRREAIGIASPVLPLTQVDLADAASLSIVHVNRVVQRLRGANVLCKASHAIEVVDREGLAKIGGFDGRYLERPVTHPKVASSNRACA